MIKTYVWKKTTAKDKQRILTRAQTDLESLQKTVGSIMRDVRRRKDAALVAYTKKFDNKKFTRSMIAVTKKDIERAYTTVDPKVVETMREQIKISRAYAETERSKIVQDWSIETTPGVTTGMRLIPLESVGLYVPAGKAPLPVVAQILTVPARAAGVKRIVVCFPPTTGEAEIIVSAVEAGATEIYRVGGVQAIAALTYGTETIKPVDFIAGPGSSYVQAAKLMAFGRVGIDMIAGPSEVLIMADKTADPRYIAADILAQCEHGTDSPGVLVTDSPDLAQQTAAEIKRQLPLLNRQAYLPDALKKYSAIIVVDSKQAVIDFANEYTAEHLEIQMENPMDILPQVSHAGSVFLGNYAPVAVGDYASGTNHTLPTGVSPRFASPVGVRMFMKASGYQYLTKDGLGRLKPIVEVLSDVEGLDAHKRSVQIRFEDK